MIIRSKHRTPPLLVSIHDVTPHTLPLADSILRRLLQAGLDKITLLIVPGLGWTRTGLEILERYQAMGISLAGHGWRHACVPEKALHRLHSRFFSRNAAEHLALPPGRIEQLIRDCHSWFIRNGLQPPLLYVPPAWAMGNVKPARCQALPFRFYETLSGVRDATSGTLLRLPLLGFEADTCARKRLLHLSNRLNLTWARCRGLPARLAIHPHDFKLQLAPELEMLLSSCRTAIGYGDDRLWRAPPRKSRNR